MLHYVNLSYLINYIVLSFFNTLVNMNLAHTECTGNTEVRSCVTQVLKKIVLSQHSFVLWTAEAHMVGTQ